MKKNVFSMLSARAALAIAAALLISLSSCKKEKPRPEPLYQGGVFMTTEKAVGGEIYLKFAIGDEPSVDGAKEIETKVEEGWLKKKYQLCDLTIKGKVTKLVCSGSELTLLDTSTLPELTYLNCSENSLASLDVSGNTKLTELGCSSNSLTSLDVSRNTKLTKLVCSWNYLASLDVSGNTKLTELNCSSNKLTSLDLSKNTGLTLLSCSNNTLASLDVRNNTKLKELFCPKNSLNGESLELPALATEGILYFKYGAKDAQMLTEDEVKDIKKNKKWAVKTYIYNKWYDYEGEERAIAMTTEKAVDEEIVLRFAPDDVPSVQGAEERGSNEWNGWLQKKYRLTAQNLVIKGKVTKFDCDGKLLTSLDVRKNTKLTALYCLNNKLTSLDLSKNAGLKLLDCSDNTLTSLDVSGNTKLTKLYCYNNKLTSLDLSKNTGLTLLSCSNNNSLKSLDVSSNTKLTALYCYKNELTFGELKLPELSAKGKLYFKYTDDGDSQTLTKDEVKEIEKNWKVYQYKGSSWVEYRGE